MNNKVALITGASSGIGRATALAFSAKGASVVLAARRQDELDSLVAEIEAGGGKATAIKTDVSKALDVELMVAHAIATFGRLDYAVNNAGIEGQIANIVDLEEDDWDKVLDINLKGNYLCLRYEARAMLDGGHGGAIVNVGSVNSFLGFGGGAAYVASKHGQVGLTTSASAELAPHGIRVNIVCPGFVDTPMHHRRRDLRQRHGAAGSRPAGRQARRDSIRDLVPLFGRSKLHNRHDTDAGWWIYFDGMKNRIALNLPVINKMGVADKSADLECYEKMPALRP